MHFLELNSSPKDECGEGACKVCGGSQASMNGNHDNHPGTYNTHLEGGEGWEQSFLRNCTHSTTRAKWLTSMGAVNLLRPCETLGVDCWPALS